MSRRKLSTRRATRVAHFLTGSHLTVNDLSGSGRAAPVIVNIGHKRKLDLAVEVPPMPLGPVASNEMWDAIYDRLVALVVAQAFKWFDLNVIDGLIHRVAGATVKTSKLDGRFDNGVIDGLVDEGTLETLVLPPEPLALPVDPEHVATDFSVDQRAAADALRATVGQGGYSVTLIDGDPAGAAERRGDRGAEIWLADHVVGQLTVRKISARRLPEE